MNQPKFKFGDKVRVKKTELIFSVHSVRLRGSEYHYYSEYLAHLEESLELYQEPQKKKLYAYCVPGKFFEVRTFLVELDDSELKIRNLIKAPDWVSEYPESK